MTTDQTSATTVGPTEELVRAMSAEKGEPAWMLDLRLRALRLWNETSLPDWGPDLSGLDLEGMTYYAPPGIAGSDEWSGLPDEILATFEKLGIPKAEREYLGGAGAQFDSGVVYHKLQESLARQGVVFLDMDEALRLHETLIHEHFMTKCVPAEDHKFTMLHMYRKA
jgi:Fe-S cluster assembly protein SufB